MLALTNLSAPHPRPSVEAVSRAQPLNLPGHFVPGRKMVGLGAQRYPAPTGRYSVGAGDVEAVGISLLFAEKDAERQVRETGRGSA